MQFYLCILNYEHHYVAWPISVSLYVDRCLPSALSFDPNPIKLLKFRELNGKRQMIAKIDPVVDQ